MEKTPMQKATTTLKALGRGEMESLAMAYLESHMLACELAGIDKPSHISNEQLGDRVHALSDEQLIALVMPISALGHSD